MTDPHPPLTRQDWSGVGYIPSTLPPPPFCLSPQGSQMTTARHSFSWPIARDPIPSSSKRGSLQETHLDRRVGPSSSVLQSTVPIANNPTYSNFQPTSMSAPVAVQSQPQDRPYQVWGERPIEPSHAPCNAVITPPPSSSRFEQLLKAKLAAEKRKPAPVAPAANVAASRGVDTAFAKLQNVDTVFNRGFVEQLYNTPAAVKEGPSSEASSSRAPQQSPYPQPQGLAQSIPQSLPQPPVTSYSVAPRFDAGMVSQNSFNPPQANSTPQGDLSSVFRAIVAERISSMYANSQQSAPAPPPLNESSFLGATSQGPWTGFSSNLGAMPASPAYASGSLPMAAPSVPQTPPTFKYEPWAEQTPVQVKIEEDWPPTSNSRGIQVKLEPDTQGQSAYPFLWNLTPPDHHNHERNASHRTPDMTHSASDSLDSISLAPLTPVMSSTLTPLSPVDVKPIINSPARSLVSLPDEVPMSYPSFGPDYSSRLSLSEQPRYNTLSDGGMDGAPGGGMYDSGDPNNHGLGGDGSNGFGNGFDFGQGASGSGGSGSGGDGEDHGDQDDGQGGGQKKRAARGKKLALACHFCRRRKLKCDGLKPSCDNCVKRNNKCEYDDNVRRRGPGRKTKEMRDRAAREAEAAGMTNDHSATYAQDLNLDPEHHPHLHEHHHYHHQPMLHGHEDEHVEVGEDVMEAMGAVIDAGLGELAAAHGDHHENIDPALMGLTGEEAVAAAAAAALSEETPTTLAEIGDVQLAQQALEYEEQERKRKLEADVEETAKRLKMDSNGHHGIGVGVGQSRSDR